MLGFSNKVISKLQIQMLENWSNFHQFERIRFVRHYVFIVKDTWMFSAQLPPSTSQCLPLVEAGPQIFLQCFFLRLILLSSIKNEQLLNTSHRTGGN